MKIKAVYKEGIDIIYTKPVYQYERGVSLTVEGLALAFPVTIYISNNKDDSNSVKYKATAMPFSIPKEYFASGGYVYVWIRAPEQTIMITIPVMTRPVPITPPDSGGSIDPEDPDLNLVLNIDDENYGVFGGFNNGEWDGDDDAGSRIQSFEDLIRLNMEDE